MMNLWLLAAAALTAAAAGAFVRRNRPADRSLAPPPTAVSPVSDEWLSQARGKGEVQQ